MTGSRLTPCNVEILRYRALEMGVSIQKKQWRPKKNRAKYLLLSRILFIHLMRVQKPKLKIISVQMEKFAGGLQPK